MIPLILILLGIACEIVKTNMWFVIPEYVSYILFCIGGLMFVVNAINIMIVKSHFNKTSREINERFDRW